MLDKPNHIVSPGICNRRGLTYQWEMPNPIQAVATSMQQPGVQSTLASAEKKGQTNKQEGHNNIDFDFLGFCPT